MHRFDLNIEDLLPHRDRMLLIDEIIAVDDKAALTSATVTEQWPLFDGRAVSALILIELVAQTAGISNGWVRIKKRGQNSDKKGWLVGIKQSRFFVDSVSLNDQIITRAENQFEYESYRHVSGIARIGDVIVGEVSLQLFQADSAD
jgi:predicted hotdog family 3-hydroxylacyl-ACP dehydratase